MKRLVPVVGSLLASLSFAACAAPTDDPSVGVAKDGLDTSMTQLPPTKLPPTTGGGGGGGSSGGTCPSGPNQCFGAIGIDCNGVVPNEWAVPQVEGVVHAGCLDGWCWINAGSWQHDECCFDDHDGRWCGGPLSANNSGCVAAWDRAVHRVQHGLGWRRRVDMCRVDTDGVVNAAEYCAPAGTVLASSDGNRCCSGETRAYSASTDATQAAAQGVVFDGSFTPVVCKAPPPPPSTAPATKKCFSTSQCAADEICIDPSSSDSSTDKYCIKI